MRPADHVGRGADPADGARRGARQWRHMRKCGGHDQTSRLGNPAPLRWESSRARVAFGDVRRTARRDVRCASPPGGPPTPARGVGASEAQRPPSARSRHPAPERRPPDRPPDGMPLARTTGRSAHRIHSPASHPTQHHFTLPTGELPPLALRRNQHQRHAGCRFLASRLSKGEPGASPAVHSGGREP
jgi:hypothetical protein